MNTGRVLPTSKLHVKRKPIDPSPNVTGKFSNSTCIDPPDKPLQMFSKAVLDEILRQLGGKGDDKDRDLGLGFDLARTFQYSMCTGRKKAVCVSAPTTLLFILYDSWFDQVGINYEGSSNALKGCIDDARDIRGFLMRMLTL